MLDLVEMEVRELLTKYKFDGDNAQVVRGAALPALNGDAEVGGVDRQAARRARQLHPRAGARHRQAVPDGDRGRVLDQGPRHGGHGPHRARRRQGRAKRSRSSASATPRRRVVTGVEMFRKLLDQGQAGDNVGLPPPRHREGATSSAARCSPSRARSRRTRSSRARSTSSRRKRAAVTRRSSPTTARSSTCGRRT